VITEVKDTEQKFCLRIAPKTIVVPSYFIRWETKEEYLEWFLLIKYCEIGHLCEAFDPNKVFYIGCKIQGGSS